MPAVAIAPASSLPWSHVEAVLGTAGDGPTCWCRWFLDTNAEFLSLTVAEKRERLRADIAADAPRGLIATVDGSPAGWVAVAPRPAYQRLARTRALAAALPAEDWADDSVWSVVCFVIRDEHRGAGLSAALLDAAVDAARDGGATVVEGYPVVPQGHHSARGLFVGVASVFERAHFETVGEIAATASRPARRVMRLSLAGA